MSENQSGKENNPVEFFENEMKKYDTLSNQEAEKLLQQTFLSATTRTGIIAVFGSFLWNHQWFLYGGIAAALLILVEPFTNHYLPFRITRTVGILFGSVIGSSLVALFRLFNPL